MKRSNDLSAGPKVATFPLLDRFPMLFSLLFVVIFGSTVEVLAQEIVVSEEIILKDDHSYEIIGIDKRTLLFRDRGNDYEIRIYDENMQLRREQVLEWEKKSTDLISISRGNDVFHVVYGYRHKGDYYLMHRVYSPDLVLQDTVVVHIEVDAYFNPEYRAALSEDYTKLLLFQADRDDYVNVIVYSLEERRHVTERRLEMKAGFARRDIRQVLLTNEGDVFVVIDHEKLSERNQIFNVLRIESGGGSAHNTEVHLGSLYAADLHCTVNNFSRSLMLGGLFNEKPAGKSIGFFLVSVGQKDEPFQMRTLMLDEEMLQNVYGKEVSASKGISNFIIQDIVLRQDGGALLIAEMVKEYSRRPSMPGRRDFAYPRGGWVDYYYDDVIIVALNPDGTQHWNIVLHKKQYSQDDDAMYSSYYLFRVPEMLRMLFNDEIRQENTISEYLIRGNGYYRRQSVFSTDYQRLRLRLRDAVQVSWNTCIVPSERNGRLSLVRITFDDEDVAGR